MSPENNTMKLEEYQEWAEKGRPLDDAAQGLLFYAIELTERTNGSDSAIPILLQVAQTAAILHVADEVRSLSIRLQEFRYAQSGRRSR